jgi:YD repeat-containing protein
MTRETRFEDNNRPFVTEQYSSYDADRQFLMKQWAKTSDNHERITEYAYPFQYDNPANVAITEMKSRHMYLPVIETTVIEKSTDGTQHVVDAAYTEFGIFNDRIFPKRQWQFKAGRPVADLVRSFLNAGNPDFRYYRESVVFDRYNAWGKPEQLIKPGNEVSTFIWGYDGKLPIAQVSPAVYGRCAFANFEHSDRGNWLYNEQDVILTESKTGTRSFKGQVNTPSMEAGEYRVSFWAKAQNNSEIQVNRIPVNIDMTWRRYEITLTNPGVVTVNTNGNFIDDLRLHPVGAQMKTFTFFPRSVLSSVTDENHITTFYEYDGLTRLRAVRDHDGNIVKHHQYQYSGQ